MPVNNAVMIILPEDVAVSLDQITANLQAQQAGLQRQAEAIFLRGASDEIRSRAMGIAQSQGTHAANQFLAEDTAKRKAELMKFPRKATRTSTALRILQLALALPGIEESLTKMISQQSQSERPAAPRLTFPQWEKMDLLDRCAQGLPLTRAEAIERFSSAAETPTPPNGGGQHKRRTHPKVLSLTSDSKDTN